MRTIDVRGLTFHALTWGEAGPLVLLVHGFPDTAHTWDDIGPRIAAEGFRVVAPFTRGIAPSEIPEDGDYGSDTLGRDVLAWIEALGEESAILVGHDFGASAVYSAAGLGPEKVRRLVTVAIPHPAAIQPRPSLLWGARHFLTHRLPGAARRFARDDFAQIRVLYERWSPAHSWSDEDFADVKRAYAEPGCLQAALDYYRFITSKVPPGQRRKLPMPSLLIGGLTDGVATEADFRGSGKRYLGRFEVAMVPGGHFLHLEHPEPFLDVLLPFLREELEVQ